jgi:DNA invertase Pin-like site-specific DNA recombinase
LDGLKLDRKFEDKASGKDLKRPEFEAMMKHVRDGDEIVVHSLDRLARNLCDLLKTVEELNRRGVAIHFVKENMKFEPHQKNSNSMAKLTLSMMGAFAEFERALIRERQQEGIELAKQRGAYKGRKKALAPDQAEQVRQRVAAGDKVTHVARDLGITRQTVYQYIK